MHTQSQYPPPPLHAFGRPFPPIAACVLYQWPLMTQEERNSSLPRAALQIIASCGRKPQIHTLNILCRIRCCITCHRIDQLPGFYKSRLLLGCKLIKSLPLCSMAPFTLLILIFLSDSFDVQFEFQSTILFWLSNPISDVWNGFNMHASSDAYSLKDFFYLLTFKS